MKDIVFDSRAELVSHAYKFKELHLGVLIAGPFIHRGLNRLCFDVEYETIAINTAYFGGAIFIEGSKERAKEQTLKIISDIDLISAELLKHKIRLQNSLQDIDKLDLYDDEIRQEKLFECP